MIKSSETADPQQYLRLLLLRLLETQKCLRPLIDQLNMATVRRQFQENEYTLFEIREWLAAVDNSSPLGPSLSSAQSAERSGPGSGPETPPASCESGTPNSPFVWRTYKPTEPKASSQVQSSLPYSTTLPASAAVIRGQIVFQSPSSTEKPPSILDGAVEKDDLV